jgi:hypothetical protein
MSAEGRGRGPCSNSLTVGQQGLTLCNNRGNQWFLFFLIPFQRFYWITSCALWILQSHTVSPGALFASLITKCNLPYKIHKEFFLRLLHTILNGRFEKNNIIFKHAEIFIKKIFSKMKYLFEIFGDILLVKMESSKLNNEKNKKKANCHTLALLLRGKFKRQTRNS